jgi:DNA-binding transcriptional MerR regulator
MMNDAATFKGISEVAEREIGVAAHVLRFWETKFHQVKPVRRPGGRRFYRVEDISLLRGIYVLLYVDGLTIRGVQKVLRDKGVEHVISIGLVNSKSAA